MDTLKKLSPIEIIHSAGMVAIIDGDNHKIIGKIKHDEVESKIDELQTRFNDVSQDADGDIVVYKDY